MPKKEKPRRIKILVADDDPDVRDMTKRILAKKGYSVDTVKNGYEALTYLKENPTHIIILDLMMPEKGGIEILSAVKNIYPNLKIVIYSGYEEYKDSIYAKRADEFLLKGEETERLLEVIQNLIKDINAR